MKNDFGFYISNLKITGTGKRSAKLTFSKGFNVISGLSETGKSYVFACINFMLGGNEPPKVIPESTGYSNILLEIKSYKNKTYTLSRNIAGGNFKVKEVGIENNTSKSIVREFKSKHVNNSKDSISSFLLELSGFDEKYVRKNKSNAKRELSFRDIAKLTLIDEEKIITEKSPVYSSGQYIQQVQEQSILEILLTGKDAKDLEQVEEVKIYQSRINGKLEFLEKLINDISGKVLILEKENPLEKQKQLQSKIDKLSKDLQDSSIRLETLTSKKQDLYNLICDIDSKNILFEELNSRFTLLKEHYNSDINRLNFITEGESFFSQLTTIKCPLCGGDLDKDHYDCMIEEGNKSSSVIDSIQKEVEKIKIKISDLNSTVNQLESEKLQRNQRLNELKINYNDVKKEIQINIEPTKSTTK
ncbi:MAG: AAA family ATPase, partial [Ignavibacteria bacterium]